jgi:hypothetical protein
MSSPHDSGWIKDYKKIFPEVKNEFSKRSCSGTKGSTDGSSYNWHEAAMKTQ